MPFDDARHFWPRQPIPVSPIGLLGFFAWGLPVLAWEVGLLWPVAALGAVAARPGPRRTRALVAAAIVVAAAGCWAWRLHATSWDHGR